MFNDVTINNDTNLEFSAISRSNSAVARVQAKFVMALQRPRNIETARVRILDACKRPRFAEKAMYSIPIGKKPITGRTIRFAEEVIRLWGNIDIKSSIISEDDLYRDISVSVLDLETNTAYEHEIRLRKTKEKKTLWEEEIPISTRTTSTREVVYIVPVTDADLLKKQNSEISKSIRNSGLRLVPPDIMEEAEEMIMKTLRGHIEKNITDERRKILDAFNGLGIDPGELEGYLDQSVNTIDAKRVEDLRLLYNSLKEKRVTWGEVLGEKRRESVKNKENEIDINEIDEIDPEEEPKKQGQPKQAKKRSPKNKQELPKEEPNTIEALSDDEKAFIEYSEAYAPLDVTKLSAQGIEAMPLKELCAYIWKAVWETQPVIEGRMQALEQNLGTRDLDIFCENQKNIGKARMYLLKLKDSVSRIRNAR